MAADNEFYLHTPGVEAEPAADGLRLSDPSRREAFLLNDVGGRIWELIDGDHTVGAIAVAIYDEFEVAWETALADCEALVAQLAAAGLVTAR
jgi:hypothetical protein